jgi:hypothetical protein
MFQPIRINQTDYKKAAADIQRSLDEIAKLLLAANKPISIDSRVLNLKHDATLSITGNGKLHVVAGSGGGATPFLLTPHWRFREDSTDPVLYLEYSATGMDPWTIKNTWF